MEAPGSVRKQREEGESWAGGFAVGFLRERQARENRGFRIGWCEQRLQALGIRASHW